MPEPVRGLVAGMPLPGRASARLPLSWPFVSELGRNETNAAEGKRTPGELPLGLSGTLPWPRLLSLGRWKETQADSCWQAVARMPGAAPC